MVIFFETNLKNIFAVQSDEDFSNEQISKLEWLFGKSKFLSKNHIKVTLYITNICKRFFT